MSAFKKWLCRAWILGLFLGISFQLYAEEKASLYTVNLTRAQEIIQHYYQTVTAYDSVRIESLRQAGIRNLQTFFPNQDMQIPITGIAGELQHLNADGNGNMFDLLRGMGLTPDESFAMLSDLARFGYRDIFGPDSSGLEGVNDKAGSTVFSRMAAWANGTGFAGMDIESIGKVAKK